MKKYVLGLFTICCIAACKDDDATGTATPAATEKLSCSINGSAFQNASGMQNLWFSYQSSGVAAYTIMARNSNDEQVRLYIQCAMGATGTFKTPDQGRVIYGDSLGDYFPAQDSGLITITRNDAQALAGTFQATHAFDTYTRTFTNGEFYIKK